MREQLLISVLSDLNATSPDITASAVISTDGLPIATLATLVEWSISYRNFELRLKFKVRGPILSTRINLSLRNENTPHSWFHCWRIQAANDRISAKGFGIPTARRKSD